MRNTPSSSFPRKRESRAGKDGSLASAPSPRHSPPLRQETGCETAPLVIPAKAGIQGRRGQVLGVRLEPSSRPPTEAGIGIWIPAFAGMTEGGAYPPRVDGLPRPSSQPPSSFPRKRESRAGKDRSLASASSRRHGPPRKQESGHETPPSSFPRKRESRAGKDGSLPSASGRRHGPPRKRESGHETPPSSFPRKRESRAGEGEALASAPSRRHGPPGGRNRDAKQPPSSFPRKRESISKDFIIQVSPCRIILFDQFDLPRPIPFLDGFFLLDGVFHGFMNLVPNQSLNAVTLRESFRRIILVSPDTLNEIRRDADIQSAVGFARKDVNTGNFH